MRRLKWILLVILLGGNLVACSGNRGQTTWEEQFDLGVRYLSEGNYKEAIIAFTTAIEIDPHQKEPLFQRASAYANIGEVDFAIQDINSALAIDTLDVSAYMQAYEFWMSMGNEEQAFAVLMQGIVGTSSEKLQNIMNLRREEALIKTVEALTLNGVTHERVLTSEGTTIYPFSNEMYGYVNSCPIDVEGDGEEELLVAFSESDGIVLRIYKCNDTGVVTDKDVGITYRLGYSDQVDCFVFYSPTYDQYCVGFTTTYVGSYTGASGFVASLFVLTDEGAILNQTWEWNNMVYFWDDLDEVGAEMFEAGWPYLDNGFLHIKNGDLLTSCKWLVRTEIDITDGMMPTEYVRYMHFLSQEEMQVFPG